MGYEDNSPHSRSRSRQKEGKRSSRSPKDAKDRSKSIDHSPKAEHSNEREKPQQPQQQNPCLYIGSISRKVTQDKLKAIFQKIGMLQYCYIVYEPENKQDRNRQRESKISRGYGFAKYTNWQSAQNAKKQLDGYQIYGQKISVEVSKRNKPRQATPGRYLGRKRNSPPRERRRREYSRSPSRQYRRRHHHDKKRRYERSRSRSRSRSPYQKQHRRRSYSYSPR